MDEVKRQSIRLLLDLQACQTQGSGQRGVGRYSHSLFSELASSCAPRELYALIAEHLPVSTSTEPLDAAHVLWTPKPPEWATRRNFDGGDEDSLDEVAYAAIAGVLNPDVIHVSHVFEGYAERVALPDPAQRSTGQVISATLFDLIPLLFQEHYFQDVRFKRWYFSRIAWLRQADLLLSISESSRQDAIQLLGIEPWRISTVHGGVAEYFCPPQDPEAARRRLAERYSLRKRSVLYTGGDDHRKNIRGAIAGFAQIPAELRKDTQLVILCTMTEDRQRMYLDSARAVGLSPGDVLLTGFVPDEDLVTFYGTCDVFVFPSLYEGLGLPILEAMACGAPVLGGNNSSIRELIVRDDALFDSGSASSIAHGITKALTEPGFANDLRSYGLKRSKDFSWKRTAHAALKAFDEALARARASGVQCAVNGWVSQKRLAVLSPLPPCRSGIADYNARFLPFLARHFEIDLYVDGYRVTDNAITSAFRVFDVKDFDAVAEAYDAILYEFGNSEFHAHMLPLLERHPGIVGLHDAYLSGLFGYLDFHCGETGRYMRDMIDAHGPRARRLFAPVQANQDAVGTSMVEFPCTKWVLDQAIGVISHSPFNLDVARENYPEGFLAPYRTIAQMVPRPCPSTSAERHSLRKKLGFVENDFIITTFGHIAWTKWGDRLLEAFLQSSLSKNPKVLLVFAGELAKDDFGLRLNKAVKKSGLGNRIRITGYLTDVDYESYLRVTDLAIQLRTKSRGGTPKGVLDCLAYGVPVAVNNDASYTDYPDNVVIKLEAEPSSEEIARKLCELFDLPEHLTAHREAGLHYVQTHHDPARCAAEYAAVIHEFIERNHRSRQSYWGEAFAPHLAACGDTTNMIDAAVHWIENLPMPRFERRRLFIDVSHIAQSDHQTGIQRVVKQIVHALYCTNRPGVEPIAVELREGKLVVAREWLQSKGLLLGHEADHQQDEPIEFQPGDVLLMLDSSWARYAEFKPMFTKARHSKVPVYTAIYDLLPITLPVGNFVDGGKEWFESWFCEAIASSDGLVCISQATAHQVTDYITDKGYKERPKVGYWHLGSDFIQTRPPQKLTEQVLTAVAKPYLLMVGTIEPRKSHALALAAMETLWKEGHDLGLCIAGKEGWMVENLMTQLRHHPQANHNLFFFEQITDVEIDFLYSKAAGLLFLSKGEGFGLPLVEAANHGTPIICSDIPVFREIAGNFATYVTLGDPQILASQIGAWWDKRCKGDLPDIHRMPRLTWEKSGEALMNVVIDNSWLWSSK
jgi:glycosyltransferase involved in cell wall biosynthesis